MKPLLRADLMSLERYAEERAAFRTRVIAHKRRRTLHLGPHLTLLFEDRLTVQYQVQEMLRIERIFEGAAIQDELDAYNPLIPAAGELKATCLLEYPDMHERARELQRLRGIEHRLVMSVHGHGSATAHADEDLDRSNADKTAAVHFLRFVLPEAWRGALVQGAGWQLQVDDARYPHAAAIDGELRLALLADLGG